MQIQKINSEANSSVNLGVSNNTNKSNQPNFKAIYIPQGVQFSEKQNKILQVIKNAFREKLPKFNGDTAENFYKNKHKLDFIIEPENENSLKIGAYRRFREKGIGTDKYFTYDDNFLVGRYDEKNPFQVDDIKVSKKNNDTHSIITTLTMLILGMVPLPFIIGDLQKRAEKTKPVIETVDTVVQKTKAEVPMVDTVIKTLKKVKK